MLPLWPASAQFWLSWRSRTRKHRCKKRRCLIRDDNVSSTRAHEHRVHLTCAGSRSLAHGRWQCCDACFILETFPYISVHIDSLAMELEGFFCNVIFKVVPTSKTLSQTSLPHELPSSSDGRKPRRCSPKTTHSFFLT